MKALIATGLGVVGLGGLLIANSGRPASAQGAAQAPTVSQAPAGRATLVNCGEGRQALISSDPRQGGLSQVDCVSRDAATLPFGTAAMPVGQQFMPVGQQFIDPVAVPQIVRPVVTERVVYRDRVAQRPASRTYTSAPRARATRASTTYERPARTRSWQRSALIIGGTTAAGAGVGAVMDGKDGAKKGAVAGLIGGTVFDIATRTKR